MTLLKTFSAAMLLTLFTASCSSSKTTTATFWVNSMKVDCDAGAGKTQCIQIYKGDDLDHAEWSFFYAPIKGFTFEPGYLQKIKVSETPIDAKNVPADAVSIAYELIEVLEKKQDPRMALNDIWVATKIDGEDISVTENAPRLEINISKMKAFGTDGCNNYTGSIKNLTSEAISFGPLAATRKMCLDMSIPDAYNKALVNSESYKREHLTLYLYNAEGQETLRFKKVD